MKPLTLMCMRLGVNTYIGYEDMTDEEKLAACSKALEEVVDRDNRWKKGQLTDEELQALCHNLDDGSPEQFQRETSEHYDKVHSFMVQAGQDTPSLPIEPDADTRVLRAKLMMEETIETIYKGLGVAIYLCDGKEPGPRTTIGNFKAFELYYDACMPYNAVETVDGCCDVKVVTTGTLIACGIKDEKPQQLIDDANLAKFGPGGYRAGPNDPKGPEGKWIKPDDWKAPDLQAEIDRQHEMSLWKPLDQSTVEKAKKVLEFGALEQSDDPEDAYVRDIEKVAQHGLPQVGSPWPHPEPMGISFTHEHFVRTWDEAVTDATVEYHDTQTDGLAALQSDALTIFKSFFFAALGVAHASVAPLVSSQEQAMATMTTQLNNGQRLLVCCRKEARGSRYQVRKYCETVDEVEKFYAEETN